MKPILIYDNGWLRAYDTGGSAPKVEYVEGYQGTKSAPEISAVMVKVRDAFVRHRRAALALEIRPQDGVCAN